ncbi:Ku protein [Cupriavidus basilensis]|uniref:Non-homologous end joining protein Ku n=1 Tax=Cupriavidus basilensis TaxID=68895 RepID=A0A0C4YST3_9BURK|nr:Ku protein [Cupriavidus basilensis]AJG24994.1 Ku domain protein [Cupriavidus basilensis]
MPAHSIASLSLSFGLVSIPVKLYTATESQSAVKFNYMCKDGSRAKQQYVSEKTGQVVERADLQKGYEFDKDRYVLFSPEELKALEESANHVVEIVAFIPEKTVDPLYYDKAYFVAPDKRGSKPYNLLKDAMLKSGRCALAKWASKGKTHMVQIRPAEDGLVFQQLLFADEVRSMKELHIEQVDVSDAELKLALQIIDQAAEDSYEPTQYEDEEKKRILQAIDAKIAGKQIVSPEQVEVSASGQVIDLMEALRASLAKGGRKAKPPAATAKAPVEEVADLVTKERKSVKRAEKVAEAPSRVRARK